MEDVVHIRLEDLQSRHIGPIEILFGYENGKYPQGNCLVIRGRDRAAIIDPALGMLPRREMLPDVDMVLLSHIHEDHIAGLHLFPDVPCFCHCDDALGLASIDGLMTIYGLGGESLADFRRQIQTQFHYVPRPDVQTFCNGKTFDLGGVRICAMHSPGHTRGHCCFVVDWDGSDERFVYLGDIELTGFGPYYGDAWSDLTAFEQTLNDLAKVQAHYWLTFHHKGLIEGLERFRQMLGDFASMIGDRERRLLAFIRAPKTMEEIVAHRFVYRPGNTGMMIDDVERRSMQQHLDRLMDSGRVVCQQGRYVATLVGDRNDGGRQ
ncbi:MAG: MBL fold metallo-hydrolase [Proteobacteria bacterium]|nr:MBL fold metallo-hydrolase [Pseudomonadota bacterium]MDA1301126.1 MBL fold metallo-hydrolase [Pseudomonadota bacterium]